LFSVPGERREDAMEYSVTVSQGVPDLEDFLAHHPALTLFNDARGNVIHAVYQSRPCHLEKGGMP
jgi:hypothetical protein